MCKAESRSIHERNLRRLAEELIKNNATVSFITFKTTLEVTSFRPFAIPVFQDYLRQGRAGRGCQNLACYRV